MLSSRISRLHHHHLSHPSSTLRTLFLCRFPSTFHQANCLAYKPVKGVSFPSFPLLASSYFSYSRITRSPLCIVVDIHAHLFPSVPFSLVLCPPQLVPRVSDPLLLPKVVVVRSSNPSPLHGHVLHLILSCLVARSHVSDFIPRLSLPCLSSPV